MYSAKIITDSGNIIGFGYEYNNVFTIDPLSGIDVTVNTSQGFQQIGTTVESMSISGISRTINGTFMANNKDAARSLVQNLPAFTTGKLYLNDDYFCEIVVSKTPVVNRVGNHYHFSFMVYCAVPFWYSANEKRVSMGAWIKRFQFPTSFDTHIFSEKNNAALEDCFVDGNTKVAPRFRFTSDSTVENYGLINADTHEYIKFNDSLLVGDVVEVYRDNNKLYVEKTRDGITFDTFYTLQEDSTLYWLYPNSNILKAIADTNEENLQCIVSYRDAYTGVVDVY